jgi:hypothetical protein
MQLLLQLLETLMKNCGDHVHSQVVERDILQEMIKIVKKKVTFFPYGNFGVIYLRTTVIKCHLIFHCHVFLRPYTSLLGIF